MIFMSTSMREKLSIEKTCLTELKALIARDPMKYGLLAAGLYLGPLMPGIDREDMRLARAAYFFARHIDDSLDEQPPQHSGDRVIETQLPRYMSQLERSGHRIAPLGRYALSELARRREPDDDPTNDFQRLLDAMYFDADRSATHHAMSSAALSQYYGNTMRATNLMLIGFRSRLRQDVHFPGFADAVGTVYSARDFSIDWPRGICNIPREVIGSICMSSVSTLDAQTIMHEPAVAAWQAEALDSAQNTLMQTRKAIESFRGNDTGALIVDLFTLGALRTARAIVREAA
jgi:phytoene/squalene synthetase